MLGDLAVGAGRAVAGCVRAGRTERLDLALERTPMRACSARTSSSRGRNGIRDSAGTRGSAPGATVHHASRSSTWNSFSPSPVRT